MDQTPFIAVIVIGSVLVVGFLTIDAICSGYYKYKANKEAQKAIDQYKANLDAQMAELQKVIDNLKGN